MSRILRPAYGLSRSEFLRAKESVRSLTTTSQFFAESENDSLKPSWLKAGADTSRPTFAQRSERTSKEVNSLLSGEAPRRGPPPGGFSRGPGGTDRYGNAVDGKVINLTSLPGRGRGSGARGAFGFGERGRGRGGGGGSGFGERGRGGALGGQGRGRGDARGRRGSARREGGGGEQGNDLRRRANEKVVEEPESLEERQGRIAREVGVATHYAPTTSLDTLSPYLPEVATDSNALGRLATAVNNMRVLAGGHVDHNPIVNAEDMYRRYRTDGSMFFNDERTREAVASQGEIGPVEEVVKETITRRAIMGEYDPVEPTDYKDAAGLVRNALRREGTYQGAKVLAFEGKLEELVSKARVRQAKPRAKEPVQEAVVGRGKGKGKGKTRTRA